MAGLGATELLIVLGIVLLLFGSAKLPQLARSLGTARREFARGQADAEAQAPARSARRRPGQGRGAGMVDEARGRTPIMHRLTPA